MSPSNDLTFIRCASCRSLVPATSSRCRMCGNALRQDELDREEDRKSPRVRQPTTSLTEEETDWLREESAALNADYVEEAEEVAVEEVAVEEVAQQQFGVDEHGVQGSAEELMLQSRTSESGVPEEPDFASVVEDVLDLMGNDEESLIPGVEDNPKELPADTDEFLEFLETREVEELAVDGQSSEVTLDEDIPLGSPGEITLEEVGEDENSPQELMVDETTQVVKAAEMDSEELFVSVAPKESAPEGLDDDPFTSAEDIAIGLIGASSSKDVSQEIVIEPIDEGKLPEEVDTTHQAVREEFVKGNEERNSVNESMIRSSKATFSLQKGPGRALNFSRTGQMVRESKPELREEPKGEKRESKGTPPERKDFGKSKVPLVAEQSQKPEVSVQRSQAPARSALVASSRLFGWLVSYSSQEGEAIELREGKTLVTRSSLKNGDLVIDAPSISTPHAILIMGAETGFFIQDLISERGVWVRRRDEDTYHQEDNSVELFHGDWVRLGDVEFLVSIVPYVGVS